MASLNRIVLLGKILSDPEQQNRMSSAAQKFARIDAAEKIAREVILLGLHKQLLGK